LLSTFGPKRTRHVWQSPRVCLVPPVPEDGRKALGELRLGKNNSANLRRWENRLRGVALTREGRRPLQRSRLQLWQAPAQMYKGVCPGARYTLTILLGHACVLALDLRCRAILDRCQTGKRQHKAPRYRPTKGQFSHDIEPLRCQAKRRCVLLTELPPHKHCTETRAAVALYICHRGLRAHYARSYLCNIP
jgi:hypothetical protein